MCMRITRMICEAHVFAISECLRDEFEIDSDTK